MPSLGDSNLRRIAVLVFSFSVVWQIRWKLQTSLCIVALALSLHTLRVGARPTQRQIQVTF